MYNVSEAYKTAVNRELRNTMISGTIKLKNGTIITITDEKVQQGSLYLNMQCVDKDDFVLGSTYSGELGIAIITEDNRHVYNDSKIELRYGLEVSPNVWEYVPLGIYTTTEATRTGRSITLKALDNLILLDEDIEGIGTTGSPHDLTVYACEKCGVTFGMTKAQVEVLPNGIDVVGLASDSPVKTCRDLIGYIAQLLGCYACCDRAGNLVYRAFKSTAVCEITGDQRWSTKISDYKVSYNGVSMALGESTYIRVDKDKPEGSTMELDTNPLSQYRPKASVEKQLDGILSVVKTVVYTPCECDYAGNPALDVGDIITVSGGNVQGSATTMITHSSWKYRGKQKLKGVGKDPKLKVKETQTQKKVNATASNTQGTKEVVYYFENAQRRNIKSTNEALVQIQFNTIQKTNPMFHANINFNISGGGTLEFTYVIDNVPHRVKPLHSVATGTISLTLFLPLMNMEGGLAHRFELLMKSDNAQGYIEKEQLQAVVMGQGLSTEGADWDGTIKIIKEIEPFSLCDGLAINMSASPSLSAQQPNTSNISVPFNAILLNTGLEWCGVTTSVSTPFVIVNHRYIFDGQHKDDYTYDDGYYFEFGEDYIKLAEQYRFEAIPQPINRGQLQMAQIDSAKFEQVTNAEIEVL